MSPYVPLPFRVLDPRTDVDDALLYMEFVDELVSSSDHRLLHPCTTDGEPTLEEVVDALSPQWAIDEHCKVHCTQSPGVPASQSRVYITARLEAGYRQSKGPISTKSPRAVFYVVADRLSGQNMTNSPLGINLYGYNTGLVNPVSYSQVGLFKSPVGFKPKEKKLFPVFTDALMAWVSHQLAGIMLWMVASNEFEIMTVDVDPDELGTREE